jgi:hypothetical protein
LGTEDEDAAHESRRIRLEKFDCQYKEMGIEVNRGETIESISD